MNDILSFEDEAQAYEEIAAMGFHAMAMRRSTFRPKKTNCIGTTLIRWSM